MTNTHFTYPKEKLIKLLLTVTLLFSIFTFSGYAGNYQSKQQQKAQTELVISSKHKTFKRALSCKKAVELLSCKDCLVRTYCGLTDRLFACNLLAKVNFVSVSRQFCSHGSATRFLQVKTIPQSSDEDAFLPFIG